MSNEQPYRFGGVDWGLSYPSCCETLERQLAELVRNDTRVQAIHAAHANGALETVEPDDLP